MASRGSNYVRTTRVGWQAEVQIMLEQQGWGGKQRFKLCQHDKVGGKAKVQIMLEQQGCHR